MRKIFAVVLGLSLVVAAAAELALGTWFSKDPLARLGLERSTAVTVAAGALYAGGHDFTYRRDAWGFRSGGLDPAKVTIVTVGGDTTSQSDLPEELTWQAVMERALQDAGQGGVVANAGVDGHSTVGHIRTLERWLPRVPGLKPRFILFSLGVNDAGTAEDRIRRQDRIAWLKSQSFFWRLWREHRGPRIAHPHHPPVDLATVRWVDRPSRAGGKPDRRELAEYRQRLMRLAELTHAMGAVPVFVTQVRGDVRSVEGRAQGAIHPDGSNGLDYQRRLAEFNAVTREVCGDKGLLCLDLARELSFEPDDFYDYVHISPSGADKVGQWLAAKLAGLV